MGEVFVAIRVPLVFASFVLAIGAQVARVWRCAHASPTGSSRAVKSREAPGSLETHFTLYFTCWSDVAGGRPALEAEEVLVPDEVRGGVRARGAAIDDGLRGALAEVQRGRQRYL
jgi:hypothetical protein